MTEPHQLTYKQKVRALRQLSGGVHGKFSPANDYDLRESSNWDRNTKRRINRAFTKVDQYLYSIHKVYRPKNRKNLKAVARAFWGEEKIPSWLTAIPVQVVNPECPASIRVRKSGRVILTEKLPSGQTIKSSNIYFHMLGMVRDPIKESKRALSPYMANDTFIVMTGDHTSPYGGNKAQTILAIRDLTLKYGSDNYNIKLSNRHYKNWLHGVRHLNLGPASTFTEYQKSRQEFRDRRREGKNKILRSKSRMRYKIREKELKQKAQVYEKKLKKATHKKAQAYEKKLKKATHKKAQVYEKKIKQAIDKKTEAYIKREGDKILRKKGLIK